jgi:hypothetical protein
MLLGGAGLTIFVGLLWLPVVSILGALFALFASRAMSRWGHKVLIPVWAAAALLCAGIMLTLLSPSRNGWEVNSTPLEAFLTFAAVSGALGVVLMPQLLAFRLSPPNHDVRAVGLLSRGAALAAGTWIVLVGIALTIEMLAARP